MTITNTATGNSCDGAKPWVARAAEKIHCRIGVEKCCIKKERLSGLSMPDSQEGYMPPNRTYLISR